MSLKRVGFARLFIVFAGLLAVTGLVGTADWGQTVAQAGENPVVVAFQCSHNDHLAPNGCCVPNRGSACRKGFHQSAKDACACVSDAGKPTGAGSSSGGVQCSHNDHMAANGCCVPNTGSACRAGFHQSKQEACACVPNKTPGTTTGSGSGGGSASCVTGGSNASQKLSCTAPFDAISCGAADAAGNSTCCCVNQLGKTQ